ncbi:hypothetical protein ACI2OX_11495 [Bacillus sp. N9]
MRAIDTNKATRKTHFTFKSLTKLVLGKFLKKLAPMQAIRIMTGAQIPEGADCVIMLELVHEEERNGQPFITIKRALEAGDNISFQGEDTKREQHSLKKVLQLIQESRHY